MASSVKKSGRRKSLLQGNRTTILLCFLTTTAAIVTLCLYSYNLTEFFATHEMKGLLSDGINTFPPLKIQPGPVNHRHDSQRRKLILYWRSEAHRCAYLTLSKPRRTFGDLKCPVDNCVWSDDKRKVKEADAVLFFDHCLDNVIIPEKNPSGRWVLVNHESPCHENAFKSLAKWDGLFNWTMTYRRDSDVYSPYGRLAVLNESESAGGLSREESLSIAKNKTKLVAWMVSRCVSHSRREKYVDELKKYIPVDVYGRCGPFVCKRGNRKCSEFHDYKFYLAFENSLAEDYVTEKLFNFIPLNVVPITRSGANYSRLGIPPELHINARHFESPKHLAQYLKKLDQNDDNYAALLREKSKYRMLHWEYSYCELCKKLNDPSEPVKWYSTLEIKKQHGACLTPNDF